MQRMKKRNSVGYFSSYDRGLECLLDIWPKVLEQNPDATLDIYYGWDIFDAVHKQNPEQMKWKWGIIRKINELDSVTEHGRVSHEELAEAMRDIKVWAYPTEFNEINCITALKAQEAGCVPVTTGCYALAETVTNNRYTVKCTDIYSNEKKQQQFIDNIVFALKDNDKIKKVPNVYWSDIAKEWDKTIKEATNA